MIRRLRPILVALVALTFAGPMAFAAADDAKLSASVQQLGADDFDAKIAAVGELAATPDPRVVKILKALEGGELYVAKDKKVVRAEPDGDSFTIFEPLGGEKIGTATSDDIDQIVVNNRVRGVIDAALGALNLFSGRRADRLAAALDLVKHPSAASVPALQKAMAAETDSEIRQDMTLALAGARLNSPDKKAQLDAIAELAGSTDPAIFNVLSALRDSPDLDPEVRKADEHAIGAISQRLQLVRIGMTLFEGLSLGSILLLAAIGLSITFGVMGVINMAHGEMIMLGAYATYVVQQIFVGYLPPGWLDVYLVASLPVAFLVTGALGIALERSVIRFLYARPLETLLATWGVSLILQQLVRTIFGAPNKAVANPSWMTGGFELIGGAFITYNRLAILVFCFVVLGVLGLVLKRTSFGLHMRAVTQNRDMAAAMGIPTARIDALTFGLGSGIAGMAGVALSQIGNVSPNLGTIYIVDSFMVVVFGGVGSLFGTLAGAMSLGIVNKLLEPVSGAVLGKVVVLIAIILFIQRRPRGLFALRGRAAEN
ncbi:MAG TPA: urea ABC transporter permease subunit UrtB [Stellaceae bacterium]|jgi:urea transport system permease protein